MKLGLYGSRGEFACLPGLRSNLCGQIWLTRCQKTPQQVAPLLSLPLRPDTVLLLWALGSGSNTRQKTHCSKALVTQAGYGLGGSGW